MTNKLIFFFLLTHLSFAKYYVTFKRWNNDEPTLTSQDGGSIFTYNYNPSYVGYRNAAGDIIQDSLIVRAQNATKVEYGVGPSVMPLVNFTYDETTKSTKFSYCGT